MNENQENLQMSEDAVQQKSSCNNRRWLPILIGAVAAVCIAVLAMVLILKTPKKPAVQEQTESTSEQQEQNTPAPPEEKYVYSKLEYPFNPGELGHVPQAWVFGVSDLKYPNHQGVTELAVYRNLWMRDGAGMPPQMTDEEEAALVQRIRDLVAPISKEITVDVDDGHSVRVKFAESIVLPEEYRYDKWNANYASAQNVAEYLLHTYGKMLNMEEPAVYIWGGSRNIYGQQTFGIRFYDAKGTTAQQLVNQQFHTVEFSYDENGNLGGMLICVEDLSTVVDTYELITPEKAQELLNQGYFVMQDKLAEGRKVESIRLVYWTAGMGSNYIPYYECLAEAPEDEKYTNDLGLKTYCKYYVPAIDLNAYCELTGTQIVK